MTVYEVLFSISSWYLVLWKSLLSVIMKSSNRNIFHVTGPLCWDSQVTGEFPTQRPVTRSFDAFLDLRLNKRLSEQPRRRWFETPSSSLWCHCNGNSYFENRVGGSCHRKYNSNDYKRNTPSRSINYPRWYWVNTPGTRNEYHEGPLKCKCSHSETDRSPHLQRCGWIFLNKYLTLSMRFWWIIFYWGIFSSLVWFQ